jgi:hypothetical protein
MSKFKRRPDGTTYRKRNLINEQFSPHTRAMLESPAYRVMTLAAHRIIARIEIELCRHGGYDNGRLPVTYEDFIEYGIHHGSIAAGIREAEALGFIRVPERGSSGNREYRRPNLYMLTFSFDRNTRDAAPPNDWEKIKTIEEAERIARAARNAKDKRAEAFGHRSWRVRKERMKIKADTGERALSTPECGHEVKKGSTPKFGTTGSPRKSVRLSRVWVRERSERTSSVAEPSSVTGKSGVSE